MSSQPRYTVRTVTTPARSDAAPESLTEGKDAAGRHTPDPFLRAPREDDDGYDPYSDRPADSAPLFEEDPWD